jgi:hypothetical protein
MSEGRDTANPESTSGHDCLLSCANTQLGRAACGGVNEKRKGLSLSSSTPSAEKRSWGRVVGHDAHHPGDSV